MKPNTQKILKYILLLGTVLAMLKIIFVDYTMDEEYQIMMSYRQLSGDKLFLTMWEPHQTSAFMCTFFMGLYHKVTGTYTGVVLFLRFCTAIIQIGLCVWLYTVLLRFLAKNNAFYISIITLNLVPKLIQIPEFGNMQLWFLIILTLSVLEYETNPHSGKHPAWIILAGLAMSLEVLSYPSSLLLFPFVCLYLFFRSPKRGWKTPLIFACTCLFCAILYLCDILRNISPEELMRNVHYVISYDLTHDLNILKFQRALYLLKGFGVELFLLGISLLLSLLCLFPAIKRKGELLKDHKTALATLLILFSELIQMFFWIVLQYSYEKYQLHLFACFFAAALVWKDAGKKRSHFIFGTILTLLTLIATLYFSDLAFYFSISSALWGSIISLIILIFALAERYREKSNVMILLLLSSFAFVCIFGKGFTLRDGRGSNLTSIRNIMNCGPAFGIFTTYMCGHMNNIDYHDFQANITPGDKVLIVTRQVQGPGTTPYMFQDAEVCHFSIVDPTSYDERLLTYWSLYPEKEPNVIAVDCWYGNLFEKPDNWIMQYISNQFHYTEVSDGEYVRFYKR